MSLDVTLYIDVDVGGKESERIEFFSANITHNLGEMASAAEIYEALWRPEEIGCKFAEDIILLLTEGLFKLKTDPAKFKKYNAPNGWGMYEHFVPWVEKYLTACKKYPKARIDVWR